MKYFWIAQHKAYFEKGYALSHYLFKAIAVLGLTSGDVSKTAWFVLFYTIGCYFLGMIVWKSEFINAEIEVGNRVNEFVKETRKFIKSK